eukprot:gnl/MRDRNA2_/MRDRNA2_95496_c0_seq1.p1 gnl/MRDRNA2_/MRDRNA2_95496_c0~~gnl/MRDRNA2_/MRDRNA2_95496_c0_seq1.p1  ORF type:complete len:308 (-),score=73.97 gnl/MRDRNA2_/MRDRNA2_95496_c0_seq1:75-998(-)
MSCELPATSPEKGPLLVVRCQALKLKAKPLLDEKDYEGAIKLYDEALGFLAEARMLASGMPEADWERMRAAAESACGPGEPWHFRILWGAMRSSGGEKAKDEEAAKLFSNMSLCHGRLGEWPKAQGNASAALHLWPSWTKAQYRLAEALSHCGQHCAALTTARQAKQGMAPADATEISSLQKQVLSSAMKASGTDMKRFDVFDTKSATPDLLEQYKALAMLEKDVFRAFPEWKAGIEADTFPFLYPDGKGVWDLPGHLDREQPVRFDDYVTNMSKMQPQFQNHVPWQEWAKCMSNRIRNELERILKP